MKISDEVLNAVNKNQCGFCTATKEEVAQAVIQAYLKDIWKPFDKDDESTWPENYASHSRPLLVLIDGHVTIATWSALSELFKEVYTSDVTHYCDPADIIPEENEDE